MASEMNPRPQPGNPAEGRAPACDDLRREPAKCRLDCPLEPLQLSGVADGVRTDHDHHEDPLDSELKATPLRPSASQPAPVPWANAPRAGVAPAAAPDRLQGKTRRGKGLGESGDRHGQNR